MLDAIDTYYDHVKERICTGSGGVPPINPARVFAGIVEAEAWPPPNARVNVFYLVINGYFPSRRTQQNFADQEYRYVLQWSWLVQGTDLGPNQVGANRGNRLRINDTMRDELQEANYPQFSPMLSVGEDAQGNIVRTPYNPVRTCRWTALTFGPRPSVRDESGVLYGAAAVDAYAFLRSISQ